MKVKITGIQEDIEALDEFKEAALEDFFSEAIEKVIELSPADTGAYIESHTLKSNNTRGRSRSSEAASRVKGGGNPEVARDLLEGDLANLDFDSDLFVMRNDAPHASDVEYGGPRWRRDGYYVYDQLASHLNTVSIDTGRRRR